MSESWRGSRLAELRELRATDPIKLLTLYRHVAGIGVDNQLPHDVSFMTMIDAILDHEALRRQSDGTKDK